MKKQIRNTYRFTLDDKHMKIVLPVKAKTHYKINPYEYGYANYKAVIDQGLYGTILRIEGTRGSWYLNDLRKRSGNISRDVVPIDDGQGWMLTNLQDLIKAADHILCKKRYREHLKKGNKE